MKPTQAINKSKRKWNSIITTDGSQCEKNFNPVETLLGVNIRLGWEEVPA